MVARQRDTAPERAIRSVLHRRGLRYRVQVKPVAGSPRRADIVFPSQKVAIFVDGCFWHGCPQHATWPKANAEFWRNKILANKRRDTLTNETLERNGWKVMRVWEHEDCEMAASKIAAAIERRKQRV